MATTTTTTPPSVAGGSPWDILNQPVKPPKGGKETATLSLSGLLTAKGLWGTRVVQPGQMAQAWDCLAWQPLQAIAWEILAVVQFEGLYVGKSSSTNFSQSELASANAAPAGRLNPNLQHRLLSAELGASGGLYRLALPELACGLMCSPTGVGVSGQSQWDFRSVSPLDAYARMEQCEDGGKLWSQEHPRFYVEVPAGTGGVPMCDLGTKAGVVKEVKELALPMSLEPLGMGYQDPDMVQLEVAAAVAALKANIVYFGIPGAPDTEPVLEEAFWEGTGGSPLRSYSFPFQKEAPLASAFPDFHRRVEASRTRNWDGHRTAPLRTRRINTALSGMSILTGNPQP